LSQRARAHTTGVTPDPPQTPEGRKKRQTRKGAASEASASGSSDPLLITQPAPSADALTLARVLRAVAEEVERDPTLAQRVAATLATSAEPALPALHAAPVSTDAIPAEPAESGHEQETPTGETASETGSRVHQSFQPRIVTGAPPELGPGVPDPFALRERLGEAGLRAALDELRLGSLRAIIREHHLDPTGRLSKQNDASKLRARILSAVAAHDRPAR